MISNYLGGNLGASS